MCVTYKTDHRQVLFASHINVIVGVVAVTYKSE